MHDARVRSEQVRTLYRQTPAVLVTSSVNAAIVCVLLWSAATRGTLAAFGAAMLVVCTLRYFLYRSYWRARPGPAETPVWARRFVAGSAVSGATWGAAGFLLYAPDGAPTLLILPLVVAGMAAAAAGTTAIYLPAFAAFVGPALLGVAARAFAIGDTLHVAMGSMVIVYALGLYAVAFVNQRSLSEAYRLRFENQALLEELSRAREGLEETNRTLELRVQERTSAFEKQAEALRDAQRLETVGRLAGGVAHDFNNLLQVVLANSNELIDRHEQGDVQPLVEIRDAAERGAELVKQLLVFGRRQGTRPETFDLRHNVEALMPLLRRLLGAGLELELTLGDAPLPVHADPAQIEILITNLVTNARDAIDGAGTISIGTEAVELAEASEGIEPGAYVLLSVRDTGIGMDSETRRRVFEPFFTTKDVGKGSGLGLAAAYGIVEQSGGKIRIDSEPARGSCFRVYLPQSDASRAAARESSVPPVSGAARTVLLVEDDASVRVVAERMLRRAGYRTLGAEHAEQALALAANHPGEIVLLITDVVMPGLSGPELARRMRALKPGISTLFMSGYSRDHRLPASDATHAVAFLPKPFTREAFDRAVANLVADAPAGERRAEPL
jgi:signal transduction histidine kinase/ActR/RegA family two-component response regulator